MGRTGGTGSIIRHDLSAHFFSAGKVAPLRGKPAPPVGVNPKPVARLPFIIHESQWVQFADRYYYLRKEGMYRFWDWGTARWGRERSCPETISRDKSYSCVILFRRDIVELLSSLAAIHVHGTAHESLSYAEQRTAARRGLLSLTCGHISDFCCRILADLGWRTRRVGAIRIEGEYNTYDNGHQLFEFYWPVREKWVLADVDMCQMFFKDGEYLNLGELSSLIQDGRDFDLRPLTSTGTGRIDSTQAVAGEFPGFENFHHGFSDPEMVKQWLHRVLTVPLISDRGKVFFFCRSPAGRGKVERYSPGHVFHPWRPAAGSAYGHRPRQPPESAVLLPGDCQYDVRSLRLMESHLLWPSDS